MFCHKCGKENPNDSKFCRYCGSTIIRPKRSVIAEENVPDTHQESLPVEELLTKESPAQCVEEPQICESAMAVIEDLQHEETPGQDAAPNTQGESEAPEQTAEQDPSKPKRYPIEFAALSLTLLCDWMGKKLTFFTEHVEIPTDTVCAFCGSTAMEPMQKNVTKIKTGGYNVESACCGTCLLGPFGLLCGLVGNGSNTSITNETWWICKNCGKQHIAHATALEKVELAMNGLWGNALLGGAICSCFLYWGISSVLLRVLTVLFGSIGIPLIIAGSQYDVISEELGYSVADIMDAGKRKSYAHTLLRAIGLFAAATLVAVPLLAQLA